MDAPFVIVAPPFTVSSNGIRSLYELCSTINRLGRRAYIAVTEGVDPACQRIVVAKREDLSPDYDTPILESLKNDIVSSGYVLYPETIIGNPLSAPQVIRYLGNKEGHCNLGQKMQAGANDFLVAHSRVIRKDAHYVLFNAYAHPAFHSADTRPYYERTLDATYIGKGHLYGQVGWIDGTLRIERTWPRGSEQLSLLLRQTRYLLTWDLWSAVTVEAVLCGAVPAILRNHPWTPQEIDASELGTVPRINLEQQGKPSMNPEVYFHQKKELEEKLIAYRASWNDRVRELIGAVDRHFSGNSARSTVADSLPSLPGRAGRIPAEQLEAARS